MLFGDIKLRGENMVQARHNDIIIWEKKPKQYIINNVNVRKYITSFSDKSKQTTFEDGRMTSTNNINLVHATQIKDINFATDAFADTYIAVTFVCEEINYLETFNIFGQYSIYPVLTGKTRSALIEKINLNLNRKWIFYFSLFSGEDNFERNMEMWEYYAPVFRIDYY